MSAVDDMLGGTAPASSGGSLVDSMLAGDAGLQAAAAKPDAPIGARIGSALNDIPRQLGLTARDALEGGANAAQILSEPIRYATDRLLGTTGKTLPAGAMAERAADWIGLPKPANANERVINEGAKLGFGAMGGSGAARLLDNGIEAAAPLVSAGTSRVGALLDSFTKAPAALAANPVAQVTSAAGAGMAGQASKEAGGSPLVQTGASVLGGLAGGLAPGAWESVIANGKRLLTPNASAAAIDQAFQTAMTSGGINLGAMAPAARIQLRQDFAQAMNTGGPMDPEALSRLAAIRAVGATPTLGMITQDPAQITREMNLAKIGASSSNSGLTGLAQTQNTNNRALIGQLNQLGGGSGVLPITAGRNVMGSVVTRANALETAEQAAWDAAKAHPGYTRPISNEPVHAAFKAADDEALLGFLPKQITDLMGAFQTGAADFTPQQYKNLRSLLSRAQAEGGNTAAAASAAVRGLESVDIRPLTNRAGRDLGTAPITQDMATALQAHDAQAGGAIDLVNQARAATRQKYAYQESSPLVRAALSDARSSDPEKLAKSFVLGGTVNDAQSVVDAVGPQGVAGIRDALGTYIKKQALNGADEETGKVSQSALKQVLDSIGDEKLRMFYSPEEVAQLRNVSRAASLMQSQPVGSAVNNSNSGTTVLGKTLDFLDSKVLRKVPYGGVIGAGVTTPLRNIAADRAQSAVLDVGPGLLRPVAPVIGGGRGLLLPATTGGALFTSGLLGSN